MLCSEGLGVDAVAESTPGSPRLDLPAVDVSTVAGPGPATKGSTVGVADTPGRSARVGKQKGSSGHGGRR